MREPRIIVADITTLNVDAIVNAANEHLAPGGGVCGAIHRAAGPSLADACSRIGGCPTGDARLTPGFDLTAKHVIHAVGPVYEGGGAGEAALLRACYERSLEIAAEAGMHSIAFPCISTGIYGYPIDAAAREALAVILAWLESSREPTDVACCCFSEADAEAYRRALEEIRRGRAAAGGAERP